MKYKHVKFILMLTKPLINHLINVIYHIITKMLQFHQQHVKAPYVFGLGT